jgi:acyl transferase domain-containing protein
MPGRPTVSASDPVLDAIAVIGIGCRFSGGASSVEDFWQMLCEGRTGHGKIPSSRYEHSAWHHPSHDRKGAVRKKTFNI